MIQNLSYLYIQYDITNIIINYNNILLNILSFHDIIFLYQNPESSDFLWFIKQFILLLLS